MRETPAPRRFEAGHGAAQAAPQSADGISLMNMLPDDMDTQLADMQQRASELDRQAKSFIRANPTAALVAAVAVGFLIGRVVTR